LLLGTMSFMAVAGLAVSPKRVVFEARDRSGALDLLNNSTTTARYQIFFEQKRMRSDGSMENIDTQDSAKIYAKDMIRYSPRRVDIEPGAAQTIRLAVRRPKDLPDGEYLSHIVFQEIPNTAPAESSSEGGEADADAPLSISLQPRLKIAIPIIVRQGELSATAGIDDVSFKKDLGEFGGFEMVLTRKGSKSLYGSVEVFELEGGKVGRRVAVIKGVGVYSEVSRRTIFVRPSEALNTKVSSYLIRFKEDAQFGGTNTVEQIYTMTGH